MGSLRIGTFVLAGQYPGQPQQEALDRAVRSVEVADEVGLDSVWLAEHHFVPYGLCPSAVTLAALLLGRTRRITVGTAVSVLSTQHPVALGEQAALLHLTSGGRFTLGVGRGGPWVDLEVFGTGREALERDFPESLDLLLRWLTQPAVDAAGERFRFRSVPVTPSGGDGAEPPPVVVACTSPDTVRLAARRGLPMLLGMHIGDEEKAEMVALWRDTAREAGVPPEVVRAADHVAAGVGQVGDSHTEAVQTLRRALPGWLRQGLAAHQTLDGGPRAMRDPFAYTELLCELHPVGDPQLCADRLARTSELTGITRFALLVEGSGESAATERNVRRLAAEVLPLLPGPAGKAAATGTSVRDGAQQSRSSGDWLSI
ncbi:LLM class flavin-dependent oxidoreductase [Streptomyces sp. DSM 44915]|uniref:LLM class flavin-dependent oxidoreductase n=1 Tax=Streptomyces chisholmiae TaxID=3075540 RepID=A0ABU2JI73_9ACTN|nr:LLM class flavin-dependent oxidoreductase [Streptomyces sp. DSM 44915]MDT0264672.1 LLM class flavin-dependent oxidoreductase [Streptomyces sp. DSM 44915]